MSDSKELDAITLMEVIVIWEELVQINAPDRIRFQAYLRSINQLIQTRDREIDLFITARRTI